MSLNRSNLSPPVGNESRAVLDEANIYLSYGKYPQAYRVLKDYLDSHPDDEVAQEMITHCRSVLEPEEEKPRAIETSAASLAIPGLEALDNLRNRIGLVSQGAVLSLVLGAIAIGVAVILGVNAMSPATFELPGDIVGQVYVEANSQFVANPFNGIYTKLFGLIDGPLGKIAGMIIIIFGVMQGVLRQSMMAFAASVAVGVGLAQAPHMVSALMEGDGVHGVPTQVLASKQPPYVLAQQLIKGGSPDRARAYVDELVSTSYQGVKDFNAQVATALEIAVYQSARSPVAIATVQAEADSDASRERFALFSGTFGAILFLVCMAATSLRRLMLSNVESIDSDVAYLLQATPANGGV